MKWFLLYTLLSAPFTAAELRHNQILQVLPESATWCASQGLKADDALVEAHTPKFNMDLSKPESWEHAYLTCKVLRRDYREVPAALFEAKK